MSQENMKDNSNLDATKNLNNSISNKCPNCHD